jgi:hypothetical protein
MLLTRVPSPPRTFREFCRQSLNWRLDRVPLSVLIDDTEVTEAGWTGTVIDARGRTRLQLLELEPVDVPPEQRGRVTARIMVSATGNYRLSRFGFDEPERFNQPGKFHVEYRFVFAGRPAMSPVLHVEYITTRPGPDHPLSGIAEATLRTLVADRISDWRLEAWNGG